MGGAGGEVRAALQALRSLLMEENLLNQEAGDALDRNFTPKEKATILKARVGSAWGSYVLACPPTSTPSTGNLPGLYVCPSQHDDHIPVPRKRRRDMTAYS